jgi:hypothetical protein
MGLVLNGGISLLSRAFGPACDGILEATLVMADGSVVSAAGASRQAGQTQEGRVCVCVFRVAQPEPRSQRAAL